MPTFKSQIANYTPYDQREKSDQSIILQCMNTFTDVLTRQNQICHLTASCWVINPEHSKALMLFHNLRQTWTWPGGHADGEANLAKVALREAHEETSLSSIRPLQNDIFSLEVLPASAHIRKGEFIPAHLHLNCSFVFEANENEPFQVKPDENSAIRWMTFDEILSAVRKGTMEEHYQKLIEKTALLP